MIKDIIFVFKFSSPPRGIQGAEEAMTDYFVSFVYHVNL